MPRNPTLTARHDDAQGPHGTCHKSRGDWCSCANLASINGLGNLSSVRQMRYTLSSCAVTTLDFRGFDPSHLTDLFYCFSGCSSLTTIYADSTWALPSSGISGSQCFYNCRSLVGGNGTVWSSGNTGYMYMRIDRTGQAGYLTAA